MVQTISLDLSSVETKEDLFRVFSGVFSFPEYFGNNWDAFFDTMISLDLGAPMFQDISRSVCGIHLVFLGFETFRIHFPEEDYTTFAMILVDLSASSDLRGDGLSFTFEIS